MDTELTSEQIETVTAELTRRANRMEQMHADLANRAVEAMEADDETSYDFWIAEADRVRQRWDELVLALQTPVVDEAQELVWTGVGNSLSFVTAVLGMSLRARITSCGWETWAVVLHDSEGAGYRELLEGDIQTAKERAERELRTRMSVENHLRQRVLHQG